VFGWLIDLVIRRCGRQTELCDAAFYRGDIGSRVEIANGYALTQASSSRTHAAVSVNGANYLECKVQGDRLKGKSWEAAQG
jgi:hypothetical protein